MHARQLVELRRQLDRRRARAAAGGAADSPRAAAGGGAGGAAKEAAAAAAAPAAVALEMLADGCPPPPPARPPPPAPGAQETRVVNLAQSLLVGACLGATPAIQLLPTSALWGYFLFMAAESLPGSQFWDRLRLLATDRRRRRKLLAGTHAPYLETVPLRAIAGRVRRRRVRRRRRPRCTPPAPLGPAPLAAGLQSASQPHLLTAAALPCHPRAVTT